LGRARRGAWRGAHGPMRRLGVALCLACAWAAPDRIVYPAIPCDRSSNSTDDAPVLLFIHVFKAAGSSVRALLRRYAERCSRRWACLVTCQDGGLLRGQNVPCRLRDTVNVKRDALFPPGARGDGKLRRNPQAALLARNADVIGGHYHYGLHNIFQAPTDRRHFYMTVLREPIATWISGMRYNDRSLKTAKSVVAAMTSELAAGKKAYSNAMSYMVESDKQKGTSTPPRHLQLSDVGTPAPAKRVFHRAPGRKKTPGVGSRGRWKTWRTSQSSASSSLGRRRWTSYRAFWTRPARRRPCGTTIGKRNSIRRKPRPFTEKMTSSRSSAPTPICGKERRRISPLRTGSTRPGCGSTPTPATSS